MEINDTSVVKRNQKSWIYQNSELPLASPIYIAFNCSSPRHWFNWSCAITPLKLLQSFVIIMDIRSSCASLKRALWFCCQILSASDAKIYAYYLQSDYQIASVRRNEVRNRAGKDSSGLYHKLVIESLWSMFISSLLYLHLLLYSFKQHCIYLVRPAMFSKVNV